MKDKIIKLLDTVADKISSNKVYQNVFFIVTFGVLFLAVMFFYPILHSGHDLHFHIMRFDALIDALQEGAFPVYIDHLSAGEYGYATKWFYSDLVLLPFAYLGTFIGLLPAYKALVIGYTLLCGYISYISIYKVFKDKYIAFLFCILYTFSYYRLYDVYNRGAVGEAICLTFMPLVIWGAYEIIKGNYKKWYILSIAFALMIYSHINTPIIVLVITAVFFIINYKALIKEPARLVYLGVAAIVSLLLTTYFVFPLLEQLMSNEFYYALRDERAISFPVQNGEPIKYIIRGLFSGATYVVPEIAGVGIVVTMCVFARLYIFRDEVIKKADIFLLVGILILFIISPLYPWKTFPFSLIGFIQFSWRFYAVLTPILAVAGAIYFAKALQTDKRKYLVGIPFMVVMSIIVISNSGQVFVNHRPPYNTFERKSNLDFGLMGAEYMPQKLPTVGDYILARGADSIRSINNETEIKSYDRKSRQLNLSIEVKNEDKLELPLIYYKGYKAEFMPAAYDVKIAKCLKIEQSENGLVQIPISQSGNVKVFFGGTIIQNVSPYITLLVTVLLSIYIVWFNRKERKK